MKTQNINTEQDINMKKQNINAAQDINKQDKDKKLEKIEKFNYDEPNNEGDEPENERDQPYNEDEESNDEGEVFDSEDEIMETKREIEYLSSKTQTPKVINTIKAYRWSLVPIYNKEKNDWTGGSGKVDERTPKPKGYDGKSLSEKPVDQKPLAEKTVDQNQLKKESPMDYVVSTMENEMPSYCDPED